MLAPQGQSPAECPRELGEFTILNLLGSGGSGTVYAAQSRRHGRVALKVLHEHLALADRERRRFFEEVERMRCVRHPSLVTLVDAGSLPDGRPYLCMPPLRGETVAARARRGRLSAAVALRYFRGLSDGVATLHGAGLVHRDIKPENVLLDEAAERAVLLDFGIARQMHALTTTTARTGAARGTPAYMAPERLFGMPASVATDVYELAVVLYVMLVGRLPWDEDTADARLQPRPPSALGVQLPSRLVTVLMKALSTRPETRPASACSFADTVAAASAAAADVHATSHDPAVGARLATASLTPSDEPRVAAEPDATFKPMSGAVIAERYRLGRLLGEGGMGEVWAATHVVTKKPVALKFLRADLAREPGYRRRFVREARAASHVRHPNVVQIHDVIELQWGGPVMVMDLLEGESLADRLAREHALSPAETALVMLPVLSAVGTAHRRGIVHRDLKPANIFLSRADDRTTVMLLDFGIAKVTTPETASEGTATLTMDGAMLGTPFYMSPEQIYGEPDVDHRSDIWALGVILFECLTGFRPTQAKSIGQILKIITNGEIVAIDELAPHVRPRLAALVMSMLSFKRDDRPQSLAYVHEELALCCVPAQREGPDAGPPRLARAAQAGSWVPAAVAVGVVALASSSFWASSKARVTDPPSVESPSPVAPLTPATPPAASASAMLLALTPAPASNREEDPSPRPAAPVPKKHGLRPNLATASGASPAGPAPSGRGPAPSGRGPAPSGGTDSWLDQR